MGYTTILSLVANKDGDYLDKEEFTQRLNQIDDPDLARNTLLKMYDEDGLECNSALWLYDKKDKLMNKISTHCPDLIFELTGDGEDHGDYWSEKWQNGKRIEFKKEFQIAQFIMDKLQGDYPEIFQGYLENYYNPSDHDAKPIIINGYQI
jgi:hypothetical protein